jgi:hypothetical protein
MPPLGFELTISAGERPKTYALDRAATGTGIFNGVGVVNVDYQVRKETCKHLSVKSLQPTGCMEQSPF